MEEFLADKITINSGETLIAIGYGGRTFVKRTDESGTPSTYKFMGEGSNITIDGTLEQVQRHSFHVTCHDSCFIEDNLGNQYSLVIKEKYEVLAKDANDIPTLVGKAPGGRFGG